jgi:uncharacterized protein YndB with AHSA1/START domain
MKLLRVLVNAVAVLIVGAVVVLLCMGLLPGARGTHTAVEIAAPPDSVFAWVTRKEYVTKWVTGVLEVREDTTVAGGVGSRETWIMQDPSEKRPMEVHSEVMRYDSPRLVDVKVWTPGMFDGEFTYTLTPTASGTRLAMDGTSHFSQWIFWLIEPLITPQANKKMASDFAKLKSLIETPAPQAP